MVCVASEAVQLLGVAVAGQIESVGVYEGLE